MDSRYIFQCERKVHISYECQIHIFVDVYIFCGHEIHISYGRKVYIFVVKYIFHIDVGYTLLADVG